ncbi:leucine-rich repeat protein [Skeletonema marinoi]|uniref:Leucine-rich repeat protein n=1 Tax=Skeletonema marinoi TaxID=267567 RepID=A0AAD9D4R8_9STRA|nr:leucine-rich repeat protein [Skeletonema marinoi]
MITENRDYDALVQDINIGDITSSEHNANILRRLRDDDPDWNKTLYILEDEIDGDIDEFIIRAGDDLGWLGYFIGRSEVLKALHIHVLPEEREQLVAFMRGIIHNQSIKELGIQTDLGDQGLRSLGHFLRNHNALTHLRFVYFHVDTDCAHNIAMALVQCRHNSLLSFELDETNISDEAFSEIATALRTQSQLEELHLGRNNIGRDGCVALVNTLCVWQSSNLKFLDLSSNNIDDLRLCALVEGMSNCSNLQNLYLSDNDQITAAGIRSMSPLFQSESCSLKCIMLDSINLGDEGAIALADGLRGNKSLRHLMFDPVSAGVTDVGWAAFSKLLCDTSSINNTYLSNHTLEWVGSLFYDDSDIPPDIRQYIAWNKDQRIDAAICKILKTHDHFDMKPFFQWKLKFLPVMVAWFQRARAAGLEHLLGSKKLSSMYDFVRSMPMLVLGGHQGQEKTLRRSRKPGIRSISPLLQSESCSLTELSLYRINFGDEGAIALADGLRGNKSKRHLNFNPNDSGITDVGWTAFSMLLCDTSSINNTYLSNHTIERIGDAYCANPPDIEQYLAWNRDERSGAATAICKILESHSDLDIKPFLQWKLKFLPVIIIWLGRAQEAGLEQSLGGRKLSSVYNFVRGMPMLVIGGQDKEKTSRRSRKRRLDGETK